MPRLHVCLLVALLLSACAAPVAAPSSDDLTRQSVHWARRFRECAVAYVTRFPAELPAASQAQQAVAVCSAVLSAYQLKQQRVYLASQAQADPDAAWAQAEHDSHQLELATQQLVQYRLQGTNNRQVAASACQ